MTNANGLTIVIGDFNAAISDSVQGVTGPHGLSRRTNDNGDRLVSFASSNDLTITNTLFSAQTHPSGILVSTKSESPAKPQGFCTSEAPATTISARHPCIQRSRHRQ